MPCLRGEPLRSPLKMVPEGPRSSGNNVAIIIRDTGAGFAPESLPRLFTPFFTTKEGGSGLGLATVKRIIDQLRGRISGNNHPDGGAEIVIILPMNPGMEHEHPNMTMNEDHMRMKKLLEAGNNEVMKICEQNWLSKLSRPSRYLDNEVNTILKDPSNTEVSIALVFPDVPEVGMSHLGLKIIYHLLNSRDWLAAERAFAPWPDLEERLRRHDVPLTAWESGRPLGTFDLIGFSLQHELSYTNILNILDLCGIPFLAEERGDEYPLIIAGGPACFNPEPVADFFDIMVIGDGEAVSLEICRALPKGET